MASAELGRCHNNPQRCAAIGNQIHNGDGVQLHGQNLHGNLTKLFCLPIHFIVLESVCLINFQGGKSLQIFKEGVAKGSILPPVFREQLLCPRLHCCNGNGDHGHADQQHNGRWNVHKAQHEKQGQWCQHGIEKLRQVGAKVGFQLIHALYGDLHDL